MFGDDVGVNPAAYIPARGDSGETRGNGGNDFVEHIIGNFFVERADVAEAPHVHLERFELDAKLVRDVLNRKVREVRLPGERAVASELGNLDVDQIIPTRMRVGESVQRSLRLRGLA